MYNIGVEAESKWEVGGEVKVRSEQSQSRHPLHPTPTLTSTFHGEKTLTPTPTSRSLRVGAKLDFQISAQLYLRPSMRSVSSSSPYLFRPSIPLVVVVGL